VSLAAASDPDVRSDEPAANLRKAYRLMNLVPATVAAWQRIRTGRDPVAARPGGSHAANFLYMLDGKEPSAEVARILDVILTLHADHEFNASTFAARVAVATVADLHSAVVAAIATLKGPRHGGANEDVLAMLLEIAEPQRAEAFVEARIGARAALSKRDRANPKTRMPGFGHRVYKVDDARARVLRGMAKSMAEATGRGKLFEVAERL
jgi:citrate synthase